MQTRIVLRYSYNILCLCLLILYNQIKPTRNENTSALTGNTTEDYSSEFLIQKPTIFRSNDFHQHENLNHRKIELNEETDLKILNNPDLVEVKLKISDIPEEFVTIFGNKENISDSYGNTLSIDKYTSIPFALAPTENFRFQRPTLLTLRKDFAAINEPPPCPQISSTGEEMGQENCLFLNIYVPNESFKNGTEEQQREELEKMPVLVFYHGENLERLSVGHIFGILNSGSAADFNPNVFVQNKIVVVTPQYRIGSLGFLSSNNEDLNGNVGLFDMLLALEWINRFISTFGGDPKQVTLMGHGGSAMSLGLLSTSELARGLFHRLILMSGSPLSPVAIDASSKTFAEIALLNSCPSFPTLRFVRCMQRRSVSSLIQSDFQLMSGKHLGNARTPLPVIQRNADGRFLPPIISSQPMTALLTGNFESVPLILGVNLAEMAGFLPSLSGKSSKDFPSTILASESSLKRFIGAIMTRGSLDPGLTAELVSFEYFSGLNVTQRIEQATDVLEELLTDFIYHVPAISLAKLWSRFAPVYFYVFNYVPSNGQELERITKSGKQVQPPNQASHGGDLNFLMSGYKGSSADRQVAGPMVEYWVNFIHKGSPLHSGIDWPQFRPETGEYVVLGDQIEIRRGFRSRQNYLWTTILPDLNSRECTASKRRTNGGGIGRNVVTFRDPEDFLKYSAGLTRNRKVVSEVSEDFEGPNTS